MSTDSSESSVEIRPGEYYEDCGYHPRLCISTDYENDEVVGISLVNGGVASHSPTHCGLMPLSFEEAVARRVKWREFAASIGIDPGTAASWP